MLVITNDGDAQSMLRYADRLRSSEEVLNVLLCVFDFVSVAPTAVDLSTEVGRSSHSLLRLVSRSIHELGISNVQLLKMRDPDPVPVILKVANELGTSRLIVGCDASLTADTAHIQLVNQLGLSAPMEVLLLNNGSYRQAEVKRAIVFMGHSASVPLARIAASLVSSDGELVPVMVMPDVLDAGDIAHRELALELEKVGFEDLTQATVTPTVVVSDTAGEVLQTIGPDADLVLAPTSNTHDMVELRFSCLRRGIASVPAFIGYRQSRNVRKFFDQLVQAMSNWSPCMKKKDRLSLFDRIQNGSQLNADFAIMMGLATVLACLGLMDNSTAVVIGAMLVAPMMTPLIGAGLALAQGNFHLFKRSIKAMFAGVIAGFILSLLFGLLSFQGDIPLEVVLRGDASIIDLLIAFFSGVAAAYAFSRTSLAESLAGVAVAAALVPPLASIGIALAYRDWIVAQGATILLTTNLAAIILGAALVFKLLTWKDVQVQLLSIKWVRRAGLVLIILVVLLLEPLGYRLAEKLKTGQIRPLAYPVAKHIREEVDERVKKYDGVSVLILARSATEHGSIFVLLSSRGPVPSKLTEELRETIKSLRGEQTPVDIQVVQQAIPSRDD